MVSVSVAIIAGGKSNRMGSDKAMLKIGDKLMLNALLSVCSNLL